MLAFTNNDFLRWWGAAQDIKGRMMEKDSLIVGF